MLRLLPPARLSRAAYHVVRPDRHLGTTYAALADYGSYRHTLFTHRLPELTAQQSPELVALHARLRLPAEYTLSTLLQALNLVRSGGLVNNFGLNTLGKNLLLYYVSEHLLVQHPRLPMPVHNAAVDAYMGVEPLAGLGRKWGIEVDSTSELDKHLANEPEALRYGRLRFLDNETKEEPKEDGVVEVTLQELSTLDERANYISREDEAYALAVRAVIGGLYTHCGEETTKKFILQHILSSQLKLEKMFQFSRPTRELTRLCEKLNFVDPLEIRLVAETGRLSAHAIYVAGAFSGGHKLGEGVGGSINEAKTRAVVNALLAYYLYSPVSSEGTEVGVPSDEKYKFEGIIGPGDVAI